MERLYFLDITRKIEFVNKMKFVNTTIVPESKILW